MKLIRATVAPSRLGGKASFLTKGKGAHLRILLRRIRKAGGLQHHAVRHNTGEISVYVNPAQAEYCKRIDKEIRSTILMNGGHSIFQAKILPAIRQKEMNTTLSACLAF